LIKLTITTPWDGDATKAIKPTGAFERDVTQESARTPPVVPEARR
jgi:hypothetical protein